MTVRWKPLVLLSALFLVVGVGGVLAITLTLVPRSSEGILRRARLAHEAGRYENAEIYYLQALQKDGKNAAIHFEAARLYKDWFDRAPAEKKGVLYNHRIDHLKSAVKFDQSMQGPRQALLKAVMHEDLVHESVEWAREVLNVDADNADAHYVLALEALDQRTPNVAEGRRHLDALLKKKAQPIRLLLVRAKLATATGDDAGRARVLAEARAVKIAADADPVDRLAEIQLTALAIRNEADLARLDDQVASMLKQIKSISGAEQLAPARIYRIRSLLEQTQRALTLRASGMPVAAKKGVDRLIDAIEKDLESIFQLALAGDQDPDLQTYVAYAEHLQMRGQRDRCIEVVERALRSPQAARRTATLTAMHLAHRGRGNGAVPGR